MDKHDLVDGNRRRRGRDNPEFTLLRKDLLELERKGLIERHVREDGQWAWRATAKGRAGNGEADT